MAGYGSAAAQGAMGGATLGSTIPGIGTLAGAGIGAGIGLLGQYFSGDGKTPEQRQMEALYAELSGQQFNSQAAQAGQSDFRNDQRQYLDQVRALANGQGPSLASNMLNQATASATENQYAQAAGARGNGALANRGAANASAMIQGQAAQAAANARVQEQLGALQQYGQGAGMARGQDDQLGMWNTGQQNQMTQFNGQQQMMNNQLRLQALGQGQQASQYQAQQPGWGDYLMALGGGLGQMRAMGQGNGLQPIAAGNPGAGGYYTPTSAQQQQGSGYGARPGYAGA